MVLKVVIMKARGNLGPKRSLALYTTVREEREREHMFTRFGCRNTIAALLVFH